MIDKAEEYLCTVLKGKETNLKTFDKYRHYQYVKSGTAVNLLVSSSICIRNGHIPRMFYLVRRFTSLLNRHFVPMDPLCYGWEVKNGYLLPKKYLREIPKYLIATCGCKECISKNCSCKRNFTKCTIYCKCEGNELCHNITYT